MRKRYIDMGLANRSIRTARQRDGVAIVAPEARATLDALRRERLARDGRKSGESAPK